MVKDKEMEKEKAKEKVKAIGQIPTKPKAQDMEKSIGTTEKDIKQKEKAKKEQIGVGDEQVQPHHIQTVGNPTGKEKVKPKEKSTEGHPP